METTKKYELSNETIVFNGVTLHRIKALKDFSDVKAGNLGGWVEKEENLSQTDNAWVYSNAKVFGNAIVEGNAKVYDNAIAYGKAQVYDDARVFGFALVCGSAEIYGNAWVFGNAEIYGNVHIFGHAYIFNNAKVCDNARVFGNAEVYDNAKIFGDAKVKGDAIVHGNAVIRGDAKVCNKSDYIIFKNFWSSGRFFTWTRSNNMWSVGCFYGTGKELIEKAYKDSKTSGKEYERVVKYVDSILADK